MVQQTRYLDIFYSSTVKISTKNVSKFLNFPEFKLQLTSKSVNKHEIKTETDLFFNEPWLLFNYKWRWTDSSETEVHVDPPWHKKKKVSVCPLEWALTAEVDMRGETETRVKTQGDTLQIIKWLNSTMLFVFLQSPPKKNGKKYIYTSS